MDNLLLAYGLILLGLLMMAAEVFLPTMGILAALGIASLIAGLAMTFYRDPQEGLIALIAVFVLIPIVTPILFHYMPRTSVGKMFILEGPEDDATVAQMPVNLELEHLRGRYGKTVSPLRPSGISEFDGRRVDTMTEGEMIDAGQWIRCIDVKAAKVIVRQVDRPPDLADMDTEALR